MKKNDKILLVFTGGTICSFADENNEKSTDTKRAESIIEENFKKSNSKYKDVLFDREFPLDVLSENMTIDTWNILISSLKKYKVNKYKGVVILHGTDTLAYTSSLLALLLAGVGVPVFLVSAYSPLTDKNTNGNENFKVAVDLICNGIKPNVYVAYKNKDGKMYVHLGAHLLQCPNFSDDFHSEDAFLLETTEEAKLDGTECESNAFLLKKTRKFKNSVLKITPYVGLDYSRISIKGVKAVVHGTYHSETLCARDDNSKYSVFELGKCFYKSYDKDGEIKVPLFLENCRYTENDNKSCYESTALAVKRGAIAVYGITSEMLYVKALVGVSLGFCGKDLVDFVLKTRINNEYFF